MQRRELLKLAASASFAWAANPLAEALSSTLPILDAHIHLFDTARPGGVPWPEKNDPIYRPALPERYSAIAAPLGVVGAIAIEASPLESDNDWVLQLAATHPILAGVIGDLVPGASTFARQLERLHANPLFLGIRCGNLWNRDLAHDIQSPAFLDGIDTLAQAALTLDTANPDPSLLHAIVLLSDRIPSLRIVIDHLPHAVAPTAQPALLQYRSDLRHLGERPNVFIKLSEIPFPKNHGIEQNLSFYKDKLDALWGIFGDDRILFGSDWPNSDHLASYADTLTLVRAYMANKSSAANRKFFSRNSIAAYRWQPRTSQQRSL